MKNEKNEKKSNVSDDSMKITVIKDGPFIVTGGIPLITSEIFIDEDGDCRSCVKSKDTLCKKSMRYVVAVTQRTNFSVTGHMQRFTLMGPRQRTMDPTAKV